MISSNIFLLEIIILIIFNLLLVSKISRISDFIKIDDSPDNERKFHTEKTPLFGGILLVLNLFFIWLTSQFSPSLNYLHEESSLFLGSILFFCIGLIDDKYKLKPLLKLTLVSVAALIIFSLDSQLIVNKLYFATFNNPIVLSNLSLPISLLCFLLLSNAFNMFDGINLQLSLYVMQILIFCLFINIYSELIILIIISLTTFIVLNYKSKIFLGDSGSNLLTFFVAFFLIKSYNQQNDFFFDEKIQGIYVEQIIILLLLPGLDMLRLFFLRLMDGRSPFSSDRNHIHHILLDKYGFKITTLIIQGITFTLFITAYFINYYYFILSLIVLLYFSLVFFTKKYTST